GRIGDSDGHERLPGAASPFYTNRDLMRGTTERIETTWAMPRSRGRKRMLTVGLAIRWATRAPFRLSVRPASERLELQLAISAVAYLDPSDAVGEPHRRSAPTHRFYLAPGGFKSADRPHFRILPLPPPKSYQTS